MEPKKPPPRPPKSAIRNPLLKICGLKSGENLRQILALEPDFVGFIFYEKSPRWVGEVLDLTAFEFKKTRKVGVFVNASTDFVFEKIEKHGLAVAQLHGSEPPDFCQKIGEKAEFWRAFGIDSSFDFGRLEPFRGSVSAFLFDTKTAAHGGSGQLFDWEILRRMPAGLPWILSGGLDLESVEAFLKSDLPRPFLIDVNSRLEDAPGLKNVVKCAILKRRLTRRRDDATF